MAEVDTSNAPSLSELMENFPVINSEKLNGAERASTMGMIRDTLKNFILQNSHYSFKEPQKKQYLLKAQEEKSPEAAKPVEETEVKTPSAAPTEKVISKTEEDPVVESTEVSPAPEENSEAAAESAEASPPVDASNDKSSESTEDETSGNEESSVETPEIKLETAPADFRFPTTNQTRHCFTRYVEYHRCVAAKGEGAPECDKFAKYYRSLCPGEWIDRWNEQRENGTFPGPL